MKSNDKSINAKRQSMSLDGEQELCCISLLLFNDFKFVLLKPRKINTGKERMIESFFFKIKEIEIDSEIIHIEKIIETEMSSVFPSSELSDSMKKKQYKMMKKNIVSITNNVLIEILIKIGFNVQLRNTRGTCAVLKMNRIKSIQRDDIGFIDKEKLMEIGKEMNKRLLSLFEKKELKRDSPLSIGKDFIDGIFSDIPFNKSNQTDLKGNDVDIINSDFGWYIVDHKDKKE